ncbi:site-specific integrase [Halosimplex litoreum]|uniref:Site-specific integrase n=1 Tax=Halosimplex litoreum TaxID=1198301 RepID=A0A7T3G190_9EURY|nr:site-specific integrase [Halosimplex litoreum]QPV64510.1 site-specific integrase [Halosimplex litoreum]
MQLRPHPKGGYAVWLTESELQDVIDHHSEDMEKQLAIKYMARVGLRADGLKNVTRSAIRRLDVDDECYIIRLEKTKRGYREAPLPLDVKTDTYALSQAMGLKQDEPVFQQSKRTYQRAVENAVAALAGPIRNDDGEIVGYENEDWLKVSAHDLRRSWATRCYYKLGGTERDLRAVMSWGGWSKRDTFEDHYLGVIPEDLLAEMMEEADLR